MIVNWFRHCWGMILFVLFLLVVRCFLSEEAVRAQSWLMGWPAFTGLLIAMIGLRTIDYVYVRKDPKPMPTVFVCETPDKLAVVVPQEHYYNALERKRLRDRADVLSGRTPLDERVSPDVMLFFPLTAAKNARMGSYAAGGEEEYNAITSGCRIVRCGMYVPSTGATALGRRIFPLTLKAGWQLIHGCPPPPPSSPPPDPKAQQ